MTDPRPPEDDTLAAAPHGGLDRAESAVLESPSPADEAGEPASDGSPDTAAPSAPQYDATAWIAWLRFVAIVAVVCIHTAGYSAIIDNARGRALGQLSIALDIGGTFAVPIFVMLSGALLLNPARYGGTSEFLRKRAWRLVPALVFWNLFYWAFNVFYKKQTVGPSDAVRRAITGELYTALYFFWIVVGLALVAPILIPWISTASRRAVIVAGAVAAVMPILTISTYGYRGGTTVWVETAWTWWIFYLGFFILGWGLRGVVLTKWWLAAAVVGFVAIGSSLSWQWRNPDAPHLLQTLSPVSYFGFGAHVYAVLLFLIAQSTIREGGVLAFLARGRASRVGRLLGDAVLGVFALHLAVIALSWRVPVIGGAAAATSSPQLLARITFVVVVTYAVVLLLRRVPVVRRVL
jgi:surface polysaccharide O-acyltransferase-like enzyme